MTSYLRPLAVAALLAVASTAAAQENQARVGLGVGFQAFDIVTLVTGVGNRISFYVPINVGPLKVEPEFGLLTLDTDGGTKNRLIAMGVGAFYRLRQLQQTNLYAGGRFGLMFEKSTPDGETSITGTDWRLAAVAGGEHFVAPAFSVGAEAQFGIFKMGEKKQSGTVTDQDMTSWQTAGVIFLRYYFM